MDAKYIFLLLVGILLLSTAQITAQDAETVILKDTSDKNIIGDSIQNGSDEVWKPLISPFVEFLGKGFLSLNVDYRFKQSQALSIGIQPMEGLMPDLMYYYLFGKRHRLELGGGLSLGFSNQLKLGGVVLHGTVGYRYQKKKGFFFRAGFTPLYSIFFSQSDRNVFLPLAGISLGYSF